MPNGGILASCYVCQFKTDIKKMYNLYYTRHKLVIHIALFTFCADLSDDRYPGLAEFIAKNNFEPGSMFQWLEIGYRTPEFPDLPQYYHETKKNATIEEYRDWAEEKAVLTRRLLQAQRMKELESNRG